MSPSRQHPCGRFKAQAAALISRARCLAVVRKVWRRVDPLDRIGQRHYITDRSVINSMSESLVPQRRRLKEARPQQLLDAALMLFVEKGFAATRAEEVAQRAGVSKGTLYLYYPSKEELLKAVIREHLSSRIAAGEAEVDKHRGSAADLLRQVYSRWWLE